jgi:RNA-directed DNA polymerase
VKQRGPAACSVSDHKEGKDEMIKASVDLQDLRRRIYVKAKADTSWRFWGLYVHVCKLDNYARRMRWPKRTMALREVTG